MVQKREKRGEELNNRKNPGVKEGKMKIGGTLAQIFRWNFLGLRGKGEEESNSMSEAKRGRYWGGGKTQVRN